MAPACCRTCLVLALVLSASLPVAAGQTLGDLRAAMERAPDDPEAIARFLVAYGSDPGNRAPRMERRGTERSLSSRLLEMDPGNPVALEVAARWELDDYLWNAYSFARFRTGYFERRRDEAYRRTEGLLQRLREAVPDRPTAHERLASLYVLSEDWPSLMAVADRLARSRPDDPAADLYRGAGLHMLADDGAAAQAFARALESMPPSRADRLRDPRFVVSPQDSSARPRGEEFWVARDPRWLTPHNERYVAHVARTVLADLLFGVDGRPGTDRIEGELLVRYGLPANVAVTVAPYGPIDVDLKGIEKRWRTPGFTFPLEDPFRNGDFRLNPDLEYLTAPHMRSTPDSFEPRVDGRRVDVPWTVAALRGSEGLTDVVVGYGIPLGGGLPETQTVALSVETGVFLSSATGLAAESRRRMQRPASSELVEAGSVLLWTAHVDTAVEPGSYAISVEFETSDGSVVGWQRDSIAVPAFGPGELAMSDLVLAYGVEETPPGDGRLVRNGLAIRPAAWGVFETTQAIYLYFEAYGLAPGTDGRARYSVEAALAPVEDGSGLQRVLRGILGGERPGGVSVRFEAEADGADDGRYLILDATGQEPGEYVLALRLTDAVSGRTVEASRPVWLVEPR